MSFKPGDVCRALRPFDCKFIKAAKAIGVETVREA